ncbi:MAG: hypothetical protein QE285_00305 [Aquabacterium sp.]|nr:hypothetical protein [Aquabacterium sp.]
MAIFILRSPEPLSEQSARPGSEGEVIAAPSHAGHVLGNELRRYCDGHIQGRSFLIAGHRGAGKTTMVARVLDDMIKLAQDGVLPMRPLPVMLHGPSLFDPLPSDIRAATARDGPAAAPTPADARTGFTLPVAGGSAQSPHLLPGAAGTVNPPPGQTGAPPPPAPAPPPPAMDTQSKNELRAQVALTQIVLGLHRAVVREYARAYRQALVPETGPWRAGPVSAERGELAAQFELEMMENPPASRLRELWDLVGALERGILFPTGRRIGALGAGAAAAWAAPQVRDQGARELVALNGICNAHQRISGELSGVSTDLAHATRELQRVTGIDLKLADAMKPATAALSGALVAGGAAAGELANLPWALLLGLATAVAAGAMFKRTATTTSKRERKIDRTFFPDLSVRTLDRVIPILLDRLRTAGLAPVFVIDELDKVDDLHVAMQHMIRFLKKLVAEGVFTCFLTDRGYMEALRMKAQEEAYGVASSYFSQPLLVAHEPGDLDDYLDRVLEVQRAGTAGASEADASDKQILKWVLRHRSQMHALALTRELAAVSASGGLCNLRPGLVRESDVYKLDATLQVVIEFLLSSQPVVSWSMQRSGMRQTLFDALYHVSRVWLSGVAELDLRQTAKAAFGATICQRMNLEKSAGRADGQDAPARPAVPACAGDGLAAADLDFLFGQAQKLARMLARTPAETIEATWPNNRYEPEGLPKAPRPTQAVFELLMLGPKSLLVEREEHWYGFRYGPSGQRLATLRDVAREPSEIHGDAVPHLAFLANLEQSLASLLGPAGGSSGASA